MNSNEKSRSKLDHQTVKYRILSNPYVQMGDRSKIHNENEAVDIHFSIKETLRYIHKLRDFSTYLSPDIYIYIDHLEQNTNLLLGLVRPEENKPTVKKEKSEFLPPPPMMNNGRPLLNKIKK